jgi:glycerate 2-kinase
MKNSIDVLRGVYKKAINQTIENANSKLMAELSKIKEDRGRFFVVGWGKSVDMFIATIIRRIPKNKLFGCVYLSLKTTKRKGKVSRLNATHPLLSRKNIMGSLEIVRLLKKTRKEDSVIIVSTGGGSAMFEVLKKSISLQKARKINSIFLKNDVDCRTINYARSCMSDVKDGKVLNFIKARRILTFIVSDDVLAGDSQECAMHVASGPTKAYPVSEKQRGNMLRRLKDIGLEKVLPEIFFQEKLDEGYMPKKTVKHIILSNNEWLKKTIGKNLCDLGVDVEIRNNPFFEESQKVAKALYKEFCSIMQKNKKRPLAYVCGGESTVRVRGKGMGGRVQELIGYLIKPMSKIPGSVVMGFGSDGQDYLKGIAGACIDDKTYTKAKKMMHNYLKNNDSYHLHKKLGTLIKSPNQTINVGDIIVFFKK